MVGESLSPSFTGLGAMRGGGLLDDAVYPVYFGVACAFFSLDLMSRSRELRSDHAGELMLKGSAQLLGLLVETVQARGERMEAKLRQAGSEIEELKKRRAEDAKANEKVASIVAAREHCWISERKSLRRQIQALLRELCALQSSKKDSVERLEAVTGGGYSEEEEKRRRELEEKLLVAEQEVVELKQRLEKEAQDHADELWKHKATLMELLSERSRMESELSRSLGQVEAAREKLKEVVLHKEEAEAMVDKLSEDVAMLQKDCEFKDKVLSAMARKSKLDTAEKQALLKQVQIPRAKQKQAAAEMDRWRQVREPKHKKKSSRASPLAEAECSNDAKLRLPSRSDRKHLLFEYLEGEGAKHHRSSPSSAATDQNSGREELNLLGFSEITPEDSYQQLKEYWIQTGTEKHAQRHHAEVAAFAEQMRQKDEKLEDFQKQILSLQLEKKMLQSHIQGLDGALSHFREESIKLEALLMEKSKELKLLKEQISSFLLRHNQNSNQSCSSSPEGCQRRALLSEVKKIKEKLKSEDIDNCSTNYSESQPNLVQEHYRYCRDDVSRDQCPGREESSLQVDQAETSSVALDSLKEEVKGVKEVSLGLSDSSEKTNSPQEDIAISDKLPYEEPSSESAESSWKKTDIHARAVSYNIKRLKQQLLVLDKLAGLLANKHLTDLNTSNLTAGADEVTKIDDNRQKMKWFLLMKSLVQKQVKRYQSLEEKTDDLCRRMYDDCRSGSIIETKVNRTPKEQTETLKCYLAETFKLQKYFVATGQKFIEMQSKISSSFCGTDAHDKSIGFNLRQFADIIRSIFRQVQKGLEVRIARMIGDLEGKLACDSILQR